MPDMLKHHVDSTYKQLADDKYDRITVMNVSDVVMVLPKHILKKAGCGERCVWETTE